MTRHFKTDKEFDKCCSRTQKSKKLFTLMSSSWAKYTLSELEMYRGVFFHDTQERYKIWRKIDLLLQNWHKEIEKFWPEHWKVSNIFTLMGSFWAKYILVEPEKYRGIIFLDNEEWWKFGEESTCRFQNRFWTGALKKLHFNVLFLTRVCNVWAKKVQTSCV